MNATKKSKESAILEPVPDNLLNSVLHAIGPEVLETFSYEQLDSVEQALRDEEQKHSHMVRVRGIIPLGFTRFYYLFLIGQDRRKKEMIIGKEHRDNGSLVTKLIFLSSLLLGSLALFVLAVGAVNNLVGPDLMELLYIRPGLEYLIGIFG